MSGQMSKNSSVNPLFFSSSFPFSQQSDEHAAGAAASPYYSTRSVWGQDGGLENTMNKSQTSLVAKQKVLQETGLPVHLRL